MTHARYIRQLHRINRVLAPLIDLVFAVTIATLVFLGIGFFYDTLLPWMARLAH